jgi:hypothetical protein
VHETNPTGKKSREWEHQVWWRVAIRHALMLFQAARLPASLGFGDGLFIPVSFEQKANMHREVFCGNENPTKPSGQEDADDKDLCLVPSRKQTPQSDGSKNEAVQGNCSASYQWDE